MRQACAFIKRSSRFDVLGLLVVWICIDMESIERFDANVDIFREAMNSPKTLSERSAALGFKR